MLYMFYTAIFLGTDPTIANEIKGLKGYIKAEARS